MLCIRSDVTARLHGSTAAVHCHTSPVPVHRCRKRYKRCTVLSLNFPVAPRRGVLAHAPLAAPLTVHYPRAYWALFAPPSGALLRSLASQRALWGLRAVPVFYNASNYVRWAPGAAADLAAAPACAGWQALEGASEAVGLHAKVLQAAVEGETPYAQFQSLMASVGTAEDAALLKVWLQDLAAAGYQEPVAASMPRQFAAMVTMLDESARDVMRNVWYWNYYRFLRRQHYPLWMFYIAGTLTEKDRGIILERLPGFDVHFFPIQYFVPRRFWPTHAEWTMNGTKGSLSHVPRRVPPCVPSLLLSLPRSLLHDLQASSVFFRLIFFGALGE